MPDGLEISLSDANPLREVQKLLLEHSEAEEGMSIIVQEGTMLVISPYGVSLVSASGAMQVSTHAGHSPTYRIELVVDPYENPMIVVNIVDDKS